MSIAMILLLGAISMSLVEALKQTLSLPKEYALAVALIIGQAFSFGLAYSPHLLEKVLIGLGVGLSAGGFFDGLKQLAEVITKNSD